MSMEDFLLTVFCLVDDELRTVPGRLRQRGPQPKLADSEVITIELVGEFLGLDRDTALFDYFRRHHREAFPRLAEVHRTTFARQAANLWAVKQQLASRLAARLTADEAVWIADSLPVYACQFARATYCRRFRGEAAYGRDSLMRQTFYGFRLHVRTSLAGVIQAVQLAPAQASDLAVLPELELPVPSIGIADRNYWSPETQTQLAEQGITLLAPYRKKSHDPNPRRSRRLNRTRRRIETVFSQLAERYRIKRTWTRDLWHLCHRTIRKVLSHAVAVYVNVAQGNTPLKFHTMLTI